jgi:hypothetical protein
MSIEHPDYILLKRRSRWLAVLWQCGHVGSCIGRTGAVLVPAGLIGVSCLRAFQSESQVNFERTCGGALLSFVAFALLTVCLVCLRAYARKRGGTFDSF